MEAVLALKDLLQVQYKTDHVQLIYEVVKVKKVLVQIVSLPFLQVYYVRRYVQEQFCHFSYPVVASNLNSVTLVSQLSYEDRQVLRV